MSFNKAILMGNLTRDPEIKQTQSGNAVANASIAVNEKWGDQEHTSYFDLTLFGKTAENFARFFKKGSSVLVEGKMRQERWEDRESGQKRSKVVLIVDRWTFTKDSNPRTNDAQMEQSHHPAASDATGQAVASGFGGVDVPF